MSRRFDGFDWIVILVLVAAIVAIFTWGGCTVFRIPAPENGHKAESVQPAEPEPWYADRELLATVGGAVGTVVAVVGHRVWYHGKHRAG